MSLLPNNYFYFNYLIIIFFKFIIIQNKNNESECALVVVNFLFPVPISFCSSKSLPLISGITTNFQSPDGDRKRRTNTE